MASFTAIGIEPDLPAVHCRKMKDSQNVIAGMSEVAHYVHAIHKAAELDAVGGAALLSQAQAQIQF